MGLLISFSFLTSFEIQAQCSADAGSLIADVTPVQLSGSDVVISATEDMSPTIPANYEVAYVLTSGSNLVIEQLGPTPEFTVTAAGEYTIHTLVAELSDSNDPNYLDTSIVVPGATTGGDVLGILNGLGICAALDVTGASVSVETCSADAGSLIADVTPVQLSGSDVVISATEDMSPTIPTNYEVAYVLTSGSNLVIEQLGATPEFTVTAAGEYTIHTLVAELSDSNDPNYIDTSIVVPGTTTGGDVLGILNGLGICAALDVTGASIEVTDNLNIEDNNLLSFKIYPNPSDNYISLLNPKQIKINSINFYDLSGKILKSTSFKTSKNNYELNISDLPSGSYIMVISSSDGHLSKQILKR
ncbi:T9SS type A sorting domain-containing protein [Psychroflexus halocasei]|nr:T9SS type A sorting domain-containing protein [Psychroflexus halocasei]